MSVYDAWYGCAFCLVANGRIIQERSPVHRAVLGMGRSGRTPVERFEQNIGLAYAAARRYMVGFPSWSDDILQEALIGLWKAAMLYNDTRKVPFHAFAWPVITNEVRMLLRRVKRWEPMGKIVSIEEVISDTEGLDYEGLLGYEPDLGARVNLEELLRVICTVGGQVVVDRLIRHKTAVEMGRKLGIHSSGISRSYQEGLRRVRMALVG